MGATKHNSGGNKALRPTFRNTVAVKSSVVRAVQYDPDKSILDVTLNNGNRYRYRHVNSWQYAQLTAGKSAGKVFNQLKGQEWHQARKLPGRATYSRG